MLDELAERTDVDRLAEEAIAALDRNSETWETDSLGEAEA